MIAVSSMRSFYGTVEYIELTDRVPPAMLAVAAMASVQLGAALSTNLFASVGPVGSAWLRLAWAALALLALTRPRPWRLARGELVTVGLLGVNSAAMTAFYIEAVARIPLGVATTIEFLGPLAVAILARPRLGALPVAGLAATGVALVTNVFGAHGSALSASGVGFALLAGAGWGSYIVLNRRVGAAVPGLAGMALALGVGAIILAPSGLLQAHGHVSGTAVLVSAGLAVLLPLAPYALEMTALRRMHQATFGILMSLEPAIGALIGFTVLGQRLGWGALAGIGCVVAASVLALRREPPVGNSSAP
jgi:inner membrane transporter RhtA